MADPCCPVSDQQGWSPKPIDQPCPGPRHSPKGIYEDPWNPTRNCKWSASVAWYQDFMACYVYVMFMPFMADWCFTCFSEVWLINTTRASAAEGHRTGSQCWSWSRRGLPFPASDASGIFRDDSWVSWGDVIPCHSHCSGKQNHQNPTNSDGNHWVFERSMGKSPTNWTCSVRIV